MRGTVSYFCNLFNFWLKTAIFSYLFSYSTCWHIRSYEISGKCHCILIREWQEKWSYFATVMTLWSPWSTFWALYERWEEILKSWTIGPQWFENPMRCAEDSRVVSKRLKTWNGVLGPPHISPMNRGNLFNLSVLQNPPPQHAYNNYTYLLELLWEFNGLI